MLISAPVLIRPREQMQMMELELDEPRFGEVRVKMVASGVCHSCLHAYDGSHSGIPVPIVLGDEGSGVVDAVGPGVTRLQQGDHVVISWAPTCGACKYCNLGFPALCLNTPAIGKANGDVTLFHHEGNDVYHYGPATYGSYIVVPESAAVKIRKDFPLEDAALIGCSVATGFGSAVNCAGLRAGQSVAVFGCGGVGLNAIQGAVATGAYPIIGVDVLDSKLELAREFGATHTINTTRQDLEAEIQKLTGHGVDATIVAVGNIKAMEQGLEDPGQAGHRGRPRPARDRRHVPGRSVTAHGRRAPHRGFALRHEQPAGRLPRIGRVGDGRTDQDLGARHQAVRPRRGRRGVPVARRGRAGSRPDRLLTGHGDTETRTMKLASVLTPLSDDNLTLAAQCGVEQVVVRYPGPDLSEFDRLQARIGSFGMGIGAVEGYLPIDRIKLGTDDGTDMNAMKALLRHLGDLGIGLVCYNFMAGTDWIRTSIDAPERGGAKTTAFCLRDLEHARIPGRPPFSAELEPGAKRPDLWTNLLHFLEEIIPVAEESGVVMAMHPDDPPLPSTARQRSNHARRRRASSGSSSWSPSPCNKITFCQGTFSEMGIDIPAMIRRLGPHIAYVHFRDVIGTADDFRETWQDNGQTDMAEAMRAYREVGFDGPVRPDHVPQMIGEDDGEPGYTMLGRLFVFGYIRGMMHATEAHRC